MKSKKVYLSIIGISVVLICLILVIGLPKEDVSSVQALSVSTSSDNLNRIADPTFLLTISNFDTNALLSQGLNKAKENDKLPLEVTEPKFEFVEQGLGIQAHLTGKLPKHEVTVSGNAKGVVVVSIEGTNVVLRPVLQQVILKEINGKTISWIPRVLIRFLKRTVFSGINTAINASIKQINAQIDPIVQPINIHPLGTEKEPEKPIKFSLGDRKLEIPAPILSSTALLIDDNGVQVMGQLLKPGLTSPKSNVQPTGNFERYQKQFHEAAIKAFDRSPDSFGKSGISLSDTFFLDYFSLLPSTSIEDNQRSSVALASKALSRIAVPTFLSTISSQDVVNLVDKHLDGILSDADLPIVFEAKPEISLLNQGVAVTAPISHALDKYKATISGEIIGSVNVSIDGTNIVLAPGFESIVIEKIDGIDLSALPLDTPDDLLSNLIVAINVILHAGIAQINAQIGTIPQAIDIQPLGTLDQPGTPVSFSIGETEYKVPTPILASSAILIGTQGIHVMGQLIKQGDLIPEPDIVADIPHTPCLILGIKRFIGLTE